MDDEWKNYLNPDGHQKKDHPQLRKTDNMFTDDLENIDCTDKRNL